jgi:4-amino-4-deoxy-L-arabinose transferase-like glycosyltransferase
MRRGIAGWLVLLGLLSIQAVCLLVWRPAGIAIVDEVAYLEQARALLKGDLVEERLHGYTGEMQRGLVNRRPVGTAALLVPLVAIGGWEAGEWSGLVWLALTVGALAWWLRMEGRSVLWAAGLLWFVPAVALSRTAMSDPPSMTLVTVGVALFWAGLRGDRRWWLVAGLVWGVSALIREPNVLAAGPFLAGVLLRRDRGGWRLWAGFAAGLVIRFGVTWRMFGSPTNLQAAQEFSVDGAPGRAALYVLLLCLVGLPWALFYRRDRRVELFGAAGLVVVFHALYVYDGGVSGLARQVVLAGRFLLPVAPLVVFCASETMERWIGGRQRLWKSAVTVVVAGAVVVSVFGQRTMGMAQAVEGRRTALLRKAVPAGAVVAMNTWVVARYAHSLYAGWQGLILDPSYSHRFETVLSREGVLYVAVLERGESGFWTEQTREGHALLREMETSGRYRVERLVEDRGGSGWTVARVRRAE